MGLELAICFLVNGVSSLDIIRGPGSVWVGPPYLHHLCLTFLPHCGSTEVRLHLCVVSAEPGSVVNSQITWSNILHKQGRRDIITSQIFLRFSGLMDLFDFFVRLCLQIIQIKPEDLATLYLQISH